MLLMGCRLWPGCHAVIPSRWIGAAGMEPQIKRSNPWRRPDDRRWQVPILVRRNRPALPFAVSPRLACRGEVRNCSAASAHGRALDHLGALSACNPSELTKITLVMFLPPITVLAPTNKTSHPVWLRAGILSCCRRRAGIEAARPWHGLLLPVWRRAVDVFGRVHCLFRDRLTGRHGFSAGLCGRGTTGSCLKGYQFRRMIRFWTPATTPFGAGLSTSRSQDCVVWIGSGWTGAGFMQGTQSRLKTFARKAHRLIFTTLQKKLRFCRRVLAPCALMC